MPKLTTELTTDFKQGMVDNTAGTRFPADALALIVNGRLEADATVRHRGGSARLHASEHNSGAIGFGAFSFIKADGTVQWILIFGDTAYKSEDYGATFSQIATGLRQDYYDFATMRVGASNYLLMANGGTLIQRWDGTTWDTLTNTPTGGVKHIAVFNGRLYVTGHNGVLVQASKIADPTVFASPDGLTVQILVSSGNTPTGLHQSGAHLLVFDERQVSYIDGFGEQTIIVASGATGVSRSVGCIAFRSIVSAGDQGVCWFSKRGIEFYTPGSEIVLLSRKITENISGVDHAELMGNPGRPTACYDEALEEYRLAIALSGTRNDIIYRASLRQRSQTRFGAMSVDIPRSLSGSVLFLGGADGYLATGDGYDFKATSSGYVALATIGADGDPTDDDGNGYLTTVVDDTMPSTIFLARTAQNPGIVHSVGYDGFLRVLGTGMLDDVLSDGTGGTAVTMNIVGKPFFFGSVRHGKKVRVAHVASVNESPAQFSVGVRSAGALGALTTATMPSTSLTQAKRKRIMVHAKGDAPQLELRTNDDMRITMLGLSAIVRKERV